MVEDYIIFQMSTSYRDHLIEKHNFYVQQAKSRLLEQFTDEAISQEANLTADGFWQRKLCDPHTPDHLAPEDFAEDACQEGVWRYQLLTNLRDNVRMSIIAGFFHEWEKSLRQWLVNESPDWCHSDRRANPIWNDNLDKLFDLLESFGWSLKSAEFFPNLDACRLVVNVHKHGDGSSLTTLSDSYPGYLESPLQTVLGDEYPPKSELPSMFDRPSHKYLKVTDANLDIFSEAIIQFWSEVPENLYDSQLSNPPK